MIQFEKRCFPKTDIDVIIYNDDLINFYSMLENLLVTYILMDGFLGVNITQYDKYFLGTCCSYQFRRSTDDHYEVGFVVDQDSRLKLCFISLWNLDPNHLILLDELRKISEITESKAGLMRFMVSPSYGYQGVVQAELMFESKTDKGHLNLIKIINNHLMFVEK